MNEIQAEKLDRFVNSVNNEVDEKINKMIVEMGGAFFEKNAAAMEQRLKECALDIHKQIDFYRKDYVEKMKVICPVGILGGIMISIMLI